MAQGIRHGAFERVPGKFANGIENEDPKDGAAWIAGNTDWPIFDAPSNPKAPFAWEYVTDFAIFNTFGYR